MATKSQTNESNILDLPKDIISSILIRFPVKQITRFKIVCKSWLALLTSDDFVELHNRHSEQFPCLEDRTLVFVAQESNPLCLASLDTKRPFTFEIEDLSLDSIISSCKGLLLCAYRGFGLVLVNPSTFQYRKLPPSPDEHESCFGFGYDHITDDYKVVSCVSLYVADKNNVGAMVYSLKANSWKKCNDHITPVRVLKPCGGVTGVLMNNNLLHWYSTSNGGQSQGFSFDICTEKWSNVPLSRILVRGLGVQTGLLCVMGNDRGVYVMKEYGVEESWVKLCNMTIEIDLYSPGSWKIAPISYAEEGVVDDDDDEVWLMKADSTTFTWYGTRGKKYRTAEVLDSSLMRGRAACTRSLVKLT